MYPHIEQQVEQLFADALKNWGSCYCTNPVTGECFVPGHDPVRPHKERAIRAIVAQLGFATQKPEDAPDLPIDERESGGTWRWQSGLHYLIEAFTRSLRCRDFRLEGHPDFDTFARGAMAHPWTPERFRQDPDLLRRFPPKPLPGLTQGLVFKLK
jgi:hypothetical protein